MFVGCMGIRAIGRALHLSPDSVDRRLLRLFFQAMAANNWIMQEFSLSENLVADGFESFVESKFFPNNFNILVGCRSQFVYFFNYAQLRRKGNMDEKQRQRAEELKRLVYIPSRQIYKSFYELVKTASRLQIRSGVKNLVITTDEKAEYQEIIKQAACSWCPPKAGYRIYHLRVSSTLARTKNNPLFPVNYIDRELRKDRSEFVRKTTRFGRDVNNQMARMALYFFAHNYLKDFRINKRENPINYLSHAELAGISSERISRALRSWLTQRLFYSHYNPSPCDSRMLLRKYSTPLKTCNLKVPSFLYA